VDDVVFSYNGEIGQIKDDAYVSSSSPGGDTGNEVCRRWLRLVLNDLPHADEIKSIAARCVKQEAYSAD